MSTLDVLRRIAAEQARSRVLAIGVGVSLAWLLLVGVFVLMSPEPAEPVETGVAARLIWWVGVILPLALIWLAVWSARSLSLLRQEAMELRAALARMQEGATPPGAAGGEARAAQGLAHAPQAMARGRASVPARAADQRQAQLELDPPPPPLTPAELFHALNFPDGPEDHEAIRCLRLGLAHPELARLIRAAQDVVTLLAAQGVYMDELTSGHPADPGLWQRFAAGERGAGVAALAGIEDRAALDSAAALMRDDPVFRDVAQHFLRHFDRLLAARAQDSDPQLLAMLAETRSGRAFVLLAQVSGMTGGATRPADPQGTHAQDGAPQPAEAERD